jgi:hypothetical protein
MNSNTSDRPKAPPRKSMSRQLARRWGLLAMGMVFILQAVNSFGCYKHDLLTYLKTLGFIAIPMLPAFVSLFTANPLRAVGASALFAPWLALAYYTDCIRPDTSGGASMVYVAVLLYGFATALLGAALSGYFFRYFGLEVRSDA